MNDTFSAVRHGSVQLRARLSPFHNRKEKHFILFKADVSINFFLAYIVVTEIKAQSGNEPEFIKQKRKQHRLVTASDRIELFHAVESPG